MACFGNVVVSQHGRRFFPLTSWQSPEGRIDVTEVIPQAAMARDGEAVCGTFGGSDPWRMEEQGRANADTEDGGDLTGN